ncbi:MarR family transcriptional regulator [Vibrio sp. Vb2880]|uniref:MarR family transcriptional regulator n=1 Tax=Vibrio furnissii TaxID=29494 RepID=A0A0Q2MIJ8_VIBFU|nr:MULTISPECIES: MarR family transcriptional regulator [Vibrio]AVH34377.1 MarR family transcriptional regulator [Vibrio fluvialis]EEX41070.1 transcriptional regulator MarR family [Vibrio furnissii CIP 102972]EKO3958889.1 MarR family transcriptional regulator [Vibrio fluvialis]ELV8680817.1 MarR family transcriptional regulator [Vibrio fluvialis]EME3969535.1 MarR family transcriptional regulator [Vibrio fluvialis]
MQDKINLLHELTNSLQPVRRAWKRAVSEVIAEHGISMSLATAVVLVYRNPQGLNQKLLAEEIGINPGALVRLLDQASQEALLERREDTVDRRIKNLHILPKGTEIAISIERAADELRLELMRDVDLAAIEQATQVLRLFEKRSIEFVQQYKSNK